MFWSKRKIAAASHAGVWTFMPELKGDVSAGALADLCADIRAHPEDYTLRNEGAGREVIACNTMPGLRIGHSAVLDTIQFWSCFGGANDPERRLISATFDIYLRDVDRRKYATLVQQLCDLQDRRAAEPTPPLERGHMPDVVRRLLETAAARGLRGEDLTLLRQLYAIAHPVLEGTHKIVPVEPATIETASPGNARPTVQNDPDHAVTAYLSQMEWHYDIGHVKTGTTIYPSVFDLKRAECFAEACGIVEVEIRLKRVVQDMTLKKTQADRPKALRDFLTDKPAHWWEDRDGGKHPSRAAMRAANVEIHQRNKPEPVSSGKMDGEIDDLSKAIAALSLRADPAPDRVRAVATITWHCLHRHSADDLDVMLDMARGDIP